MTTLIWLDLETTGLDPQHDRVLEVYATTAPLADPFALDPDGYHRVLHHGPDTPTTAPIHQVVLDMHEKNGLWKECLESAAHNGYVELELCERFPEVRTPDGKPDPYVLAGSSVHFDLAFVRAHFPWFAKRLSHRVFDVSAVGLFAQSGACGAGMPKLPKAEAHRAKEDVLESVANARKMAKFFKQLGMDEGYDAALRAISP